MHGSVTDWIMCLSNSDAEVLIPRTSDVTVFGHNSLKRWLLWNDVILWALSQSEWDPYKKGNFWMLMCTHAERPYEYRDKMADSLREICQKG